MTSTRAHRSESLLFDCLPGDLAASRRATGTTGGVWTMRSHGGDHPWDPREARLLVGHELYVGRVVPQRDGGAVFLAFENVDDEGRFVGRTTDPMPIELVDGEPALPTWDRPVLRAVISPGRGPRRSHQRKAVRPRRAGSR